MDRRNVLKNIGRVAGAIGTSGLVSGVAQAQSGSTIKIGFISSLSGTGAFPGQEMLLGAQIAVDQVNSSGGVNGKKIELLIRDDKSKPTDGTVAARELMGSGANLLVGVVSSTVALAISAMLAQEKSLLITCAAHSEKLTKENFVRNYFRVTDNPYMRMRAMAKLAAERYPSIDRWGGIIPDHEFGRTSWAAYQDGLLEFYPSIAKKKPSIVDPIRTAYGAADYRNGITNAMALPADGFFITVYGSDAVTLFKQAEPYGFFKKAKLIIDPANELIVAKAMKKDFPEMWVGAHWSSRAFEDVAASQALVAEAMRRTKDPYPMGFLSEGHAGVMAYVKAIQAAGTNETEAVLKALESITFETATGPRRFRKEDHQAIKPVVIYKLRGTDKKSEGFEFLEIIRIPGEDVIDPPTPGKPLKLRST